MDINLTKENSKVTQGYLRPTVLEQNALVNGKIETYFYPAFEITGRLNPTVYRDEERRLIFCFTHEEAMKLSLKLYSEKVVPNIETNIQELGVPEYITW